MTIKCVYCGGRGWAWHGVARNAERVPCEPCGETGRAPTNWWGVGGTFLLLVSMLVTCAFILWTTTAAFGQTAGGMTLAEFRRLADPTKSALVAGAMATTEYVGMACPDPQRTVAEYVSALTWRKQFDAGKPWIAYYFTLTDEHGCRVEVKPSNDPTPGA